MKTDPTTADPRDAGAGTECPHDPPCKGCQDYSAPVQRLPTPAPSDGPVLGEEVRRAVEAVLAPSCYSAGDDGTSLGFLSRSVIHSITPHVAALVRAAEQRGAEKERERKAAEDKDWNEAVDWLVNYEGDPDVQDPFWAIAEGTVTREEANRLSAEAVRARRHADPNSDAFGAYPDARAELP